MNTPTTGRSKRAHELKQAVAFFYEHAGYSYDPKTETPEQGRKRCAVALARAERDARKRFLSWEWRNGDECIGCECGRADCACASKKPHDCYTCLVRDDSGNVVASLGSICEPSAEYRRVIEAELAMEALAA